MAKLVSTTYGDALFELALEMNQVDAFQEEVKAIMEALEQNRDLTKLMNHPKITKVEEIFTDRVSKELVGLMTMLVEKGHGNEMLSTFAYFIQRVKEHKNIGTAYVTSAMDLSEEQKKAIEKRLLETTKYVEFEMHFDTDAELIGGMIIRIGDRVVDSSVRTKLSDLTRQLSQIQLKVGECAQ